LTAGTYVDVASGFSFKPWLVMAQVPGLTWFKFIGIRVIAEISPERRAGISLGLIAVTKPRCCSLP
jgi:hypothetical protein